MKLEAIDELLNHESGLKGLSGLSSMRTPVEAAERGHQHAALAIKVFCYWLARALGGLATALERIDAVVFTGGIGQHNAPVRAATLRQLKVLGCAVDDARNLDHGAQTGGMISLDGAVPALVITTDEERTIARDTAAQRVGLFSQKLIDERERLHPLAPASNP